jgi:hypothetical protein
MSIIELPKWMPRKRRDDAVIVLPEYDPHSFRVSKDELDELDRAAKGEPAHHPLGTPVKPPRTARVVADDIEWVKGEIEKVEGWLKHGRENLAELTDELKVKIDDELAAKQAAHDADVAELESLRPATGETA